MYELEISVRDVPEADF